MLDFTMESHEKEPADLGRASQQLLSPGQPDCLLVIGSQRLPAVLGEESDAGLWVLIQGSPLFWVEDAGVLQTAEVEIAVCVSNIVRMETEEDEFSSRIPAFRIGLARLDQTEVPLRSQPAPAPLRKACPNFLSRLRLNRLRVSKAGLIALVTIVTPLVFLAAAWHQVPKTNLIGLLKAAGVAQDTQSSTMKDNMQLRANTAPDPAPEMLRLPGVEPFLNSEVAKKLELTPLQMGTLRRLDKATQQALQDLEKYWESPGRLELARRRNVLLEAARHQALQSLTDHQRQQWEAMTR